MHTLNHNDLNFIERFVHAFKKIGGNKFGCIDYTHFKNVLKEKNVSEDKDLLHIIESGNHVNNDKLDFISLCCSIVSVKLIFNDSLENGRINSRVNSNTFIRDNGSPQSIEVQKNGANVNLSSKKFSKSLKGLLFNLNGDLRGYRYQLELLENSAVEIFAKPVIKENASIEVLIFQDSKTKAFITSSFFTNDDACTVKVPLKRGRYILIPILLKWDLFGKSNSLDSLFLDSLTHTNEVSGVSLTTVCRAALRLVFDSIDLDGNGYLNQPEFEFFVQHTTGESTSGEWAALQDNFEMENNQLTFEGFLELYKMVLQTDPSDVKQMFQQMGLNESMEYENAQPFNLTVKAVTSKFSLVPLSVSSYSEVSEKVLRKVVVEHGASRKAQNMKDLFLFIHRLPHRATIVVLNQSHSPVKLQLDCSRSENCMSHRGTMNYCLEVDPRSGVIGHHLFPINTNSPWNAECEETLL